MAINLAPSPDSNSILLLAWSTLYALHYSIIVGILYNHHLPLMSVRAVDCKSLASLASFISEVQETINFYYAAKRQTSFQFLFYLVHSDGFFAGYFYLSFCLLYFSLHIFPSLLVHLLLFFALLVCPCPIGPRLQCRVNTTHTVGRPVIIPCTTNCQVELLL